MRYPQAGQPDEDSADRYRAEFAEFEQEVLASVFAKGPIPVSEPGHDGCDAGGDDLRANRALEEVAIAEDAEAKGVEYSHVDEIPDEPNNTKFECVAQQLGVKNPAEPYEVGDQAEDFLC